MPDRIESFKVICRGGLNSNENHLDLADNSPGSATRLINYEPSLFGGYRRLEGYEPLDVLFPEVGAGSAEGPVLCVAVFRDLITPFVIAARKDIGTDTYTFYRKVPGVSWTPIGTGRPTTDGFNTIKKIRHVQFDFGGGNMIAFADGINPPLIYDGLDFFTLNVSGVGTSNDPGGDQMIQQPALVDAFENHLFFSGAILNPSLVVHSAPNDPFDFTAASGAGQILAGFPVVQIKPFRDSLFVFGSNSIRRIRPDFQVGFVIEQVTANVGCIARDSVQEIGGDLIFLSPDGFRPVAGTSRIGDVELESLSKPIQSRVVELIGRATEDTLNSVVVRQKSQVRFFFGDGSVATTSSIGIIGGLTNNDGQISWEFGDLRGIRASCATSEFVGVEEFVLHGDYDGNVYRQERGQNFNGEDIVAIYSTPYLDFGDTEIRKVLHRINTFVRAEGPFTLNLSLQYDWGDQDTARPNSYDQESLGAPTVFGGININYGGSNVTYGGNNRPVMISDLQGSGYSVRATFVSVGQTAPHTIQGMVFEFALSGRR